MTDFKGSRGETRAQPVGLAALEARVREDLTALNYPPPAWPRQDSRHGEAQPLDVLVVGGGMCGQTAAFAMRREGIARVRVIDRHRAGAEGPWATWGRMLTLRSPKHLTGPDLGIPSLTFRAWFMASHGQGAWERLHKIDRRDWPRYLLWLRHRVGLEVDNGVELVGLDLSGALIRARLRRGDQVEEVCTRKLVLAPGREGLAEARWPAWPSWRRDRSIGHRRVFHASEDIDFAALRGRRVAVLGAGATAFDNAATALGAGASSVQIFARRAHLPQVNKAKWSAFPGFLHGFPELDAASRWKFFRYILDQQIPPPWESVLRCEAHAGFGLRLGSPWRDLQEQNDAVRVHLASGIEVFDSVILATGFSVRLEARPELLGVGEHILRWADRLGDGHDEAGSSEASMPFLDGGFRLMARGTGAPARLSDVHYFGWGAMMSLGALAAEIPGLATGVNRLVRTLCADLFLAQAPAYFEDLRAFEEPELAPTRWHVPPQAR